MKVIHVIPQAVSGILGGGSSAGYNPTAAAAAVGGMAAAGVVGGAAFYGGKALGRVAKGPVGLAKGALNVAGGLAQGLGKRIMNSNANLQAMGRGINTISNVASSKLNSMRKGVENFKNTGSFSG